MLIEGLLADVGGWTSVGIFSAAGGVLVAARGVTAAAVGLLIRLADTDVGGWADGGLAVACSVAAAGGWLVSRLVDAADGAELAVCGAVAAEDGGWDTDPGVVTVEG